MGPTWTESSEGPHELVEEVQVLQETLTQRPENIPDNVPIHPDSDIQYVFADQYWTGKYFSSIGDIDEMRHYHHMYLFDTSRSDPPVSGNLTLTANGKSHTLPFPGRGSQFS